MSKSDQISGISGSSPVVVDTFVCKAADELEELLERVLSYKESGISLLERDKEAEIWQYGQGILFTVTVVTTIGKSKWAGLNIQL